MKNIFINLLIVFFILSITSCTKTIDANKEEAYLELRNEIKYYKGSPFTGVLEYSNNNGLLEYKASYKEGKKDGPFEEYFENGQLSVKGAFTNNEEIGSWEEYYENGQLYAKRSYIVNKPQIPTIDSNESSMVSVSVKAETYYLITEEEEIPDHKKDNEWMYYYANGQVMAREFYKKGIRDGEWKSYFVNGKTKSRSFYKEGKADSIWRKYYENGQLSYKRPFKNGQIDGTEIHYNSKGWVTSKVSTQNGELHGIWEQYHYNGKIRERGYYKNGKEHGTWEYYNDRSELNRKGNFKAGNKVGQWKYSRYTGGEPFRIVEHECCNLNNLSGIWSDDCENRSAESYVIKFFKSYNNEKWIISGGIEGEFGGTIVKTEYDIHSDLFKITYINNNEMGGDGTIQTFEFYHDGDSISFNKFQHRPKYLAKELTNFLKCK